MSSFMTADSLARSCARAIVQRIQDLLWLEYDGSHDPDKVWDTETIEQIAALMDEYGLRPTKQERR
jgi:hypothetical protein